MLWAEPRLITQLRLPRSLVQLQLGRTVLVEGEIKRGTRPDLPFDKHLTAVLQDQPPDVRQPHTCPANFISTVELLEQVEQPPLVLWVETQPVVPDRQLLRVAGSPGGL